MEPAPVAKPPQKPLPSSAIHPTPPLSFSVDDADLDDCLDDNEFTAEEQEEAVTAVAMAAYRPPPTPEAAKNLSKVANAVASCSALSFFSISMILANKALAFVFKAKLHLLPVAFQCLVAVILVESSRRIGWVHYEPFKLATAIQWLPIAVFFCAMLLSSFLSYEYMNVPMVTVFKSLTNLLIVTGDFFWHQQRVSFVILASLAIMTGGAFFAARSDIEFSAPGYFWMSANCFATAGYVLTMKFATRTMKLPKFGMVFYNNLLGSLIMLPLAIYFGELYTRKENVVGFLDRTDLHTPLYIFINLFAGAAGFFLNFAALWCVSATSATTYAVVNTVNNFPVSIIGFFVFADKISPTQAESILVNILGGFVYSGGKIMEQKKKERQEAERDSLSLGDVEAMPLVAAEESPPGKRSPGRRV